MVSEMGDRSREACVVGERWVQMGNGGGEWGNGDGVDVGVLQEIQDGYPVLVAK